MACKCLLLVLLEVNKKFLAAAAGNWLEWYDFGVYAALAKVIGSEFFPAHDASVRIMQSFMAFAAGGMADFNSFSMVFQCFSSQKSGESMVLSGRLCHQAFGGHPHWHHW